jgi:hypothetical protein
MPRSGAQATTKTRCSMCTRSECEHLVSPPRRPPPNAPQRPPPTRRIMYFIYFRSEPWDNEVRDYEKVPSYPPMKRKEAEMALIKVMRGGMQLPANPLPAGCAFDSARDGASFEVFIAIMRDCWRAKNVSGVAVVFRGRKSSLICARSGASTHD